MTAPSIPEKHAAIGLTEPNGAVSAFDLPTPRPGAGELLVKAQYIGVTPLSQWQVDFNLLISEYPFVLSGNVVGEVVALGSDVREELQLGDTVMVFQFGATPFRPTQEYVLVEQRSASKVPPNITPEQAASIPDNFVTVWHAFATELSLPLPSSFPITSQPPNANLPILVWGGGSSVGLYATQVLRLAGYTRIMVAASPRHFERLRGYGATHLFDYRDPEVTLQIRRAAGGEGDAEGNIAVVLDCIGDEEYTVRPISRVVGRESRVGLLLPIRVGGYGSTSGVIMETNVPFPEGVEVKGVRTHFYQQNTEFKERLQPVIMRDVFASKAVLPTKVRLVEGASFVERTVNALALIRDAKVSGEKLVVKV